MKFTRSLLSLAAAAVAAFSLPVPQAFAEAPPALRARQEKIQSVVTKVSPAVVCIQTHFDRERPDRNQGAGSGSGVIVSEDGLVLTAAHVLQAVGEKFDIILANGDRVEAKSLGKAFGRDAALAQITEPGKYPHVDRADAKALTEGEWCLALGHPGGYEVDRSAPVRLGRVVDTDADGFIVSDCTLSGGDSGGPLFNLEGKLIGIHSSIGMRLAENRHVPMAAFDENWDRMMKGDSWGRLGMRDRGPRNRTPDRGEPAPADTEITPDTPLLGLMVGPGEEDGAVVESVGEQSPAGKAGVRPGDVIVKFDGKDVDDHESLVGLIRAHKPGDTVKLGIDRDGKSLELEATLVAARDVK